MRRQCEKKFLRFRTMASEYATNEISKYLGKQKNKHINRAKTKITRSRKKRRKRRYLEKKVSLDLIFRFNTFNLLVIC